MGCAARRTRSFRRVSRNIDVESLGTTAEEEGKGWVDESEGSSDSSGRLEGTCASGRHLIVLPKVVLGSR